MSNGTDKLAEGIGKVIEAVPDIYTDAFKPSVSETGKTLALIPRAVNAALAPLQKWIIQKEFNIIETEKILAKKLENIPADKIVTPDAHVAVPAIQAISYSMDSVELRELYANLLAKSMNLDSKDSVHPAYVETIKQLSPKDAAFFKLIKPLDFRQIVDVKLNYPNSLERTLFANVNILENNTLQSQNLIIDNLCRLGLIEIPKDIWYGNPNVYDQLITTVKKAIDFSKYKDYDKNSIGMEITEKRIDITFYGESFYDTCVI